MKNNKIGALILSFGIILSAFSPVNVKATNVPGTNGETSNEAAGKFKTDGLTIPEVVEQNRAAVVTVAVKKIANYGLFQNGYQEGVGSGFFIDSKGFIATNNHVIENADEVTIILYDGKEVPGLVRWTDPENDLAIVQIDASKYEVPGVVSIGNSDDVKVGEQVIAIGNPMSAEFAGTVTAGIISSKNREVIGSDGRSHKYLQTDAAINGGNSGGPLFNSRGQVIGINSAKIAAVEIEGISFAIPINVLLGQMNSQPSTQGQTNAPTSIGVSVKDVTKELAEQFNVPQGVMIMEVAQGSAAYEAGLLPEDIITYFAGERITTGVYLNTVKSQFKPGDVVKVRIFRVSEGKEYEGELKLKAAQ